MEKLAVPYDYYRIFYYVAQHKSFTRAAEALGNNQPNITRCMNNLEQDLGCKLFVRTNHGVSLTPDTCRTTHLCYPNRFTDAGGRTPLQPCRHSV